MPSAGGEDGIGLFSVVELRDAHGKEWGMRHFHFAKRIAR